MAALLLGDGKRDLATALALPQSKNYFLFYFIMILGIPFAYHKGVAFQGVFVMYLGNMIFFVLLVSHISSFQKLKSMATVICASTLTYGFFGGLLLGLSEGRVGVFGGVFDPNDTALVLLALFPMCLYFIRFNKGLTIRAIALIATGSSIAVILLTGSRGGILGLASILLIMLVSDVTGVAKGQKFLFLLIIAATCYFLRDFINVERYLTLTDLASDYNATAEGGRIDLWIAAINLVASHPITGVGVECYAFAQYLLRENAGAEYLGWLQPHNSMLQIASEVGVIGFFIFALIIIRSLATFFKASRLRQIVSSHEASEFSNLAGLMFLGFAGLLVSGFFLSQGYSNFFTLYFALAASIRRIQGTFNNSGVSDRL